RGRGPGGGPAPGGPGRRPSRPSPGRRHLHHLPGRAPAPPRRHVPHALSALSSLSPESRPSAHTPAPKRSVVDGTFVPLRVLLDPRLGTSAASRTGRGRQASWTASRWGPPSPSTV